MQPGPSVLGRVKLSNSLSFGFLHTGKKLTPSFYREHILTAGAILTDNGRVFCIAFREDFYERVEILQEDLDCWLIHDDTEGLSQGLPQPGQTAPGYRTGIRMFVRHDHASYKMAIKRT